MDVLGYILALKQGCGSALNLDLLLISFSLCINATRPVAEDD
jgi:hypothetical protein